MDELTEVKIGGRLALAVNVFSRLVSPKYKCKSRIKFSPEFDLEIEIKPV